MRAAQKENVLVRPDCFACERPTKGNLYGDRDKPGKWRCEKCYLTAELPPK